MNFVSNKQNFIIKEAHKVLTAGCYRNTRVDRGMALCQPGYSAEKQPGVLSSSISVTKTAFLYICFFINLKTFFFINLKTFKPD